ncbi:MAG: hypothetical protein OXR72_04145 [Gemmatimonadota bacterium]|nr:hypothetical protein [Gemmatimonadota bacterium]
MAEGMAWNETLVGKRVTYLIEFDWQHFLIGNEVFDRLCDSLFGIRFPRIGSRKESKNQ